MPYPLKRPSKDEKPSIALVSAPWPLFNQPSIQLGSLKAYLKSEIPGIDVDAHHFYLRVAAALGYPRYRAISQRTWLAESVYAALLYPEKTPRAERLFQKEARRMPLVRKEDFKSLVQTVGEATDAWIASIDWPARSLAGFSLCLCQLTSSLYCIARIKALAPQLPIVAGGSLFAGESVPQLMRAFPQIDFMVTGEGEKPLANLVRDLASGAPAATAKIAGLTSRMDLSSGQTPEPDQLPSLDRLPFPDFDDYFQLLGELSPRNRFFPTLPAEISRGCYRQRQRGDEGSASGCAFCNLNRQWRGYRMKSADRAAREIDHLTARHRVLSISFMDNLLPERQIPEIFRRIGSLGKDLRLFGEIRATTPFEALLAMRTAGVREVQIGIEALSSRLLSRMNKGTTAIENLAVMKHCEALGIENRANLICGFPGSDDADVSETLAVLPFALPFRPLQAVHFWLGTESPVWRAPESFGIRSVVNHPDYRALFPDAVLRQVTFTIQAYRGDRRAQRRRWLPVEKALRNWTKIYETLHRTPHSPPILSYRDGGDFLIIRQRRPGAAPLTHRLEKTSREIYLFCRHIRNTDAVTERFRPLSPEKIGAFLREMTAARLMFSEKGRHLSLAVPADGSRPTPL